MSKSETIELGVVVERRKIDNPWQDYDWLPVAVFLGAALVDDWVVLADDGTVTKFHAATLPLEIYRSDTEAYRENMASENPSVFVTLTADDEAASTYPYLVQSITVSPYEAQDVTDSGEEIIERVVMPDDVLQWLGDFVDEHHVDKPFIKRKRDKLDVEEHKFGKQPVFLNENHDPEGSGNG